MTDQPMRMHKSVNCSVVSSSPSNTLLSVTSSTGCLRAAMDEGALTNENAQNRTRAGMSACGEGAV